MPPQYDLGRIPVPLEHRSHCLGMNAATSQLAGILNNGWTTIEKLRQADALLVTLARDALILQGDIAIDIREHQRAVEREIAERAANRG